MMSSPEVIRLLLSQRREANRRGEPEVFEQWVTGLQVGCLIAETILIPGHGEVSPELLLRALRLFESKAA